MRQTKSTFLFLSLLLALACKSPEQKTVEKTLFTLLPAAETGIDFANNLTYDKDFNIFTYRNFYNGGGVALGDIDNDGLLDVFLTANMGENRLYRNKGNFQFEDITGRAGIKGKGAWSTGVSMADVNGDGLLDIYVCNSGDIKGDNKQNELFLNNGDGTFTEKAEEYGLADRGYSTHAVFFDYDKDGDLDMYLLNNSYQAIGSFNLRKNERPKRDPVGGDKLFRNDGGRFTDVSEKAGIYGSIIGFGLGVTVGDINLDGWQDIYVSNDFFERDYIYLNNGDGTFREVLKEQMQSISGASMGADMADINNDGYPDIFVTEMLPEEESRLKTVTTFENWDRYQYNLQNDYYHQFTRNMLQLNNGRTLPGFQTPEGLNEGGVTFSEIGRLAGVEATDWSWGALITDLDNDGHKDIFVANGIFQDLTNQDYIQFISNEEILKSILAKGRDKADFKQLIDPMPSNPVPNYAFANEGGLRFRNKAEEWGLATPSFSNGSAYGDLDNDGDLDLVVNNVNMPLFVYRNEANIQLPDHHYLKLSLVGEGGNTAALGTKITLRHQGQQFYLEQMPMRGFQSSVDPRPHFGLGGISKIDSVLVEWPDGRWTVLTEVRANQTLMLHQKEAVSAVVPVRAQEASAPLLFTPLDGASTLAYPHVENHFVDFDRDRLLFHMLSTQGPRLAVGDVNGDGLQDVYVGGAKDSPGALLLQHKDGSFRPASQAVFEADRVSEDTDAVFFDADRDGDLDLYVTSGGNEFPEGAPALADRLYLNDGRGSFRRSEQLLPTFNFASSSCVRASDLDGDGDLDLFVGVRLRPFLYGLPAGGYVLENDGKGNFTDVTGQVAPQLQGLGMVSDAMWADVDGDGKEDLVVVGEWMPVSFFRNEGGRLKKMTQEAGLGQTSGWWNRLAAGDFNGDGKVDFVAGNHGLNSRFRATAERPASILISDFDGNGTVEQVISTYNGERSYPLVLRHDLVAQLPGLKKKYLRYESYQGQTVEEIFTPEQLKKAIRHEAQVLETSVLLNRGDGTFMVQALPVEAQLSPVYGLLVDDFDKDGQQDILLGGNLYGVKPEVGRYDASHGLLLKGDGRGGFTSTDARSSGFNVQGQVRDLVVVKTAAGQERLLVARNNDTLQLFSVRALAPKGLAAVPGQK